MGRACEMTNHPPWLRCAPSSRGYRFIHGTTRQAHARIRAGAKRCTECRSFCLMIAAHAESRRMTMVTRDAAIRNLKIEGLKIVSW